MAQFNILEKLTEKFEELKDEISTNNETLKDLYNQKEDLQNEIYRINEVLSELGKNIALHEDKKDRLTSILTNTQENFEQVQSAASSLLEIMDTKSLLE